MALQMKAPVVKEFVLWNLDETGEAKITFKQASAIETQLRDQLVFAPQTRTWRPQGMEIRDAMPWSIRIEIEVRLTIIGAVGILDPNGEPLFRFKNGRLDMTPEEFHTQWGKINPPAICDRFLELCWEVNPDWSMTPPNEESEEENPSLQESG